MPGPVTVNIALERWNTNRIKIPAQIFLCARSRSGKTNCLMAIVRGIFDNAFRAGIPPPIVAVFCNSTAVEEYYLPAGIPPQFVHKSLDLDALERIIEAQQAHVKKSMRAGFPREQCNHVLLLFDDVATEKRLLEHPTFKKLVFNGRQSNISFIFATQFIVNIPTAYRGAGTIVGAWRPETALVARHMVTCWFGEFSTDSKFIEFFEKTHEKIRQETLLQNAQHPQRDTLAHDAMRFTLVIKEVEENSNDRMANIFAYRPPLNDRRIPLRINARQRAAGELLDIDAKHLDALVQMSRPQNSTGGQAIPGIDSSSIPQMLSQRNAVVDVHLQN